MMNFWVLVLNKVGISRFLSIRDGRDLIKLVNICYIERPYFWLSFGILLGCFLALG